jgi:hypothetical protein
MGLLLGPELFMAETSPPPDVDEQIAVIQRFIGNLVRYSQSTADDPQSASARLLQQSLASFLTLLVDKPPETKARLLHRLQENLLHSFPGRMKALEASLEAEAFASEDLPPDLTARWRSPNQIYRAEVFPAQDLNNTDASRQFVHAVRTIAPEAIGLPVIYLDAGNAVVSAFQKAFMLALVAITTLLFFLLKPKSDVLLIIFPLLLAGLLTGAASVVLNIPFNFANIIALPLLLGIGVDNGIHMVHRMRTAPPADGHILTTSTARAVLFSSLTTISSFGNLAFSPHRGMASMGIMLTLGIGFALFCTLIILPAFLEAYIHTSEK